jgi:hypothetical protein
MEEFKLIEFQRTRDFSRKMNATFEFIKQNFKPLFKSILFIAGPPALIGSMMMGSFMGDFMSLTQNMANNAGNPEAFSNYFISVSFWLQLVLTFVFLLISGVVTMATINNYILMYGEKKSNQIEVSEVWEMVRSTFWTYLGSTLLFFILFVAAYLLTIIPAALLMVGSPFIGFLLIFGFIIFLFYLAISFALTFFIQAYEKKNFFSAIIRSNKLVRGKWWSTFGLIIILSLIVSTVSYIFIIPWYIVTIADTLHNTTTGVVKETSTTWEVLTIVFFTLYYLAQFTLATLPNVGIAFQYFNLVELKESKGLMDQIETLGKNSTEPTRPEEHF